MKSRIILLLIILITACQSTEKEADPAPNRFQDPVLREIHDLQDRRDAPGLLKFLENDHAAYRAEAAMALGSVQDSFSVPSLGYFLDDADGEVRKSAAWAIGQTGHIRGAGPLVERFRKSENLQENEILCEAIGKCGDSLHLNLLVDHWYQNGKDEKMAGAIMQAVYRFGLRGITNDQSNSLAAAAIHSGDEKAQMITGAYFGRVKNAQLPEFGQMKNWFHTMNTADSKLQFIRAIGRDSSNAAHGFVVAVIRDIANDYRVRVNAIRSLEHLRPGEMETVLGPSLKEENFNVGTEAAMKIKALATKDDLAYLDSLCHQNIHWRAKSYLFGTMLMLAIHGKMHSDTRRINAMIREELSAAESPYYKGHLLLALSEDPSNEGFLFEHMIRKNPVIPVYAMEGISNIFSNHVSKDIHHRAGVIKAALKTGDVGIAAMAATLVTDPSNMIWKGFSNTAEFDSALTKLTLPRDIETYHEIEKAINFIKKEEKPLTGVPTNNPIDWEHVQGIAADQTCVFSTELGDITLQLFVEDAPATVSNFIKLVESGFYGQPVFHRVVADFVAQGGCPRGDGWGSSDQSIRSEWPDLHYGEGYIGMASAGKDTESCQWFITHCSTPHLDGRYTIFGKVIKGMDIVHLIEIGDNIKKISLPGRDQANEEG